ncbi:MAG: hypothetical protein A3K68_07970 [Euryarchaeota archaeon RBG_16_68_13]|nr:MAG: hypothetical protein A3K68_07970 [Euryarchaeota archaeon RBG_16_68_13]
MTKPIACPSCFSTNKPTASRCRVCGQKLKESRARHDARPVFLERAMSGEIFTAIIGRPAGGGLAVRDVKKQREALETEDAQLEEYRELLESYESRLRSLTEDARRSLDGYARSKRRRRRKELDEDEVEDAIRGAMNSFRSRQYSDVVAELEEFVARHDTDPRAWVLLGESNLKVGRSYDAAASFFRSLELNPRSDRGWLGLAKALRSVEDYDGALDGVEKALRINPNLVEGWAERGMILEALQNLAEALRSFARVQEIRPGHAVAAAHQQAIETQLAARARASGVAEAPEDGAGTAPGIAAPAHELTPAVAAEASVPQEPQGGEVDLDELLGLNVPPAAAPSPRKEEEVPTGASTIPVPRPAGPVARPARVKTYVDGLDEALDGGIPWGHIVLLEGTPGTLKSSLGFSILLHNAVRDGRHGIYLSFEERSESLLRQMASLGMDLQVQQGSVVLLDPRTAGGLLSEKHDWIDGLERALEELKKQKGLDLVVLDSLEALEVLARFQDRRREMFRLFEWLRDLDVTAFVIAERPDWIVGGHVLQGRWDEDFLADGVLQVRLHMVSDLEVQRRIRVMKMRGARHETGYLSLVVDEGRFQVTRALSP